MGCGVPNEAVSLPTRGLGLSLMEVLVLLLWIADAGLSIGVCEMERKVLLRGCRAQMLMASVRVPASRRYLSSWFHEICCRLWVAWLAAGKSLRLPVVSPILTRLLDDGGFD